MYDLVKNAACNFLFIFSLNLALPGWGSKELFGADNFVPFEDESIQLLIGAIGNKIIGLCGVLHRAEDIGTSVAVTKAGVAASIAKWAAGGERGQDNRDKPKGTVACEELQHGVPDFRELKKIQQIWVQEEIECERQLKPN